MKTRSQNSTTCSTIAVITAIIPVLGWVVSGLLITVSLILSVSAIAANEKGGIRAFVNTLLSIPASVAVAAFVLFVIGS